MLQLNYTPKHTHTHTHTHTRKRGRLKATATNQPTAKKKTAKHKKKKKIGAHRKKKKLENAHVISRICCHNMFPCFFPFVTQTKNKIGASHRQKKTKLSKKKIYRI